MSPSTLLRPALLALLFVLVLPRQTASAQAPRREVIEELLGGIESSATEAEWRAMGEATVPLLVAIFDDASEPQPVRLRAVWAARFFSTEASRRFLTRVASDASQPGMVVRSAAQSLAAAFERSAVPVIAPLLAHADPAVREATIAALVRVGGSEARAALAARRGRETELAAALERALSAIRD
jgi:HEAT repeat protein